MTDANSSGLWYPMSWMVSCIQWIRPSGRAFSAAATMTSRCRENWELARSAGGPAATISAGMMILGSTFDGGSFHMVSRT